TPEVVSDFVLNRFADRKVLTERDRFLFYFAGHGDALNGTVGYLQFGNARPGDFARGVLRMDDINVWSQALKARDALFLIDACASGLLTARQVARSDPTTNFSQLLKAFSAKGSRTVITAGTAGEATYEVATPGRQGRGNGVFTRSFLDAALAEETDQ